MVNEKLGIILKMFLIELDKERPNFVLLEKRRIKETDKFIKVEWMASQSDEIVSLETYQFKRIQPIVHAFCEKLRRREKPIYCIPLEECLGADAQISAVYKGISARIAASYSFETKSQIMQIAMLVSKRKD